MASVTGRDRTPLSVPQRSSRGHQRLPTVTDGSGKPQVAGYLAQAAGTTQAGDSHCGPRKSARFVGAADGQQATAIGTSTTAGESWRIVEALGH
jgi:hypothetical protein